MAQMMLSVLVKGKNGATMELGRLAREAGSSIHPFHRHFEVTKRVAPGETMGACRALALQDALRVAVVNSELYVAVEVGLTRKAVSFEQRLTNWIRNGCPFDVGKVSRR